MIVSPLVNVPTGMVVANEVVEGLLVMKAVAPLVPPVIVSPTKNCRTQLPKELAFLRDIH